MEEFERELRQALARRPAPVELKQRIMRQRARQPRLVEQRQPAPQPPRPAFHWQRMAASIAVAAVLASGLLWREQEQRRQGEEARAQVMIALRITGHALNHMSSQLAAHDRANQE
jgi:hypothetical protein